MDLCRAASARSGFVGNPIGTVTRVDQARAVTARRSDGHILAPALATPVLAKSPCFGGAPEVIYRGEISRRRHNNVAHMIYRAGWAGLAVAAVGAIACSSSHERPADAATDVVYAPRDHNPDYMYPEAGPPSPLGTPLPATDEGQWSWIDFPDTHCRDGSSTGLGLNMSTSSPNVMVFLDQGGACFNADTCAFNLSAFGASDFVPQGQGIFNRSDPDNPVRDWSFVFIPYCSGDVHAGNRSDGSVESVGPQQFLGYSNLDAFLSRIVPTFAGARQVLFAGSSADGFGVLLNADHVARWFCPRPRDGAQ